jgi:phospholipase C
VHEPNVTDWRRRTFGDLTSAFRFHDARTRPPGLPGTARELADAQWEVDPALPGADQIPPRQKPGHRPHV